MNDEKSTERRREGDDKSHSKSGRQKVQRPKREDAFGGNSKSFNTVIVQSSQRSRADREGPSEVKALCLPSLEVWVLSCRSWAEALCVGVSFLTGR